MAQARGYTPSYEKLAVKSSYLHVKLWKFKYWVLLQTRSGMQKASDKVICCVKVESKTSILGSLKNIQLGPDNGITSAPPWSRWGRWIWRRRWQRWQRKYNLPSLNYSCLHPPRCSGRCWRQTSRQARTWFIIMITIKIIIIIMVCHQMCHQSACKRREVHHF